MDLLKIVFLISIILVILGGVVASIIYIVNLDNNTTGGDDKTPSGKSCSENDECASGICQNQICVSDINGICSVDADCKSGNCISGKCAAENTENLGKLGQPPNGGACEDDLVIFDELCLLPVGGDCKDSNTCASGLCSSAKCQNFGELRDVCSDTVGIKANCNTGLKCIANGINTSFTCQNPDNDYSCDTTNSFCADGKVCVDNNCIVPSLHFATRVGTSPKGMNANAFFVDDVNSKLLLPYNATKSSSGVFDYINNKFDNTSKFLSFENNIDLTVKLPNGLSPNGKYKDIAQLNLTGTTGADFKCTIDGECQPGSVCRTVSGISPKDASFNKDLSDTVCVSGLTGDCYISTYVFTDSTQKSVSLCGRNSAFHIIRKFNTSKYVWETMIDTSNPDFKIATVPTDNSFQPITKFTGYTKTDRNVVFGITTGNGVDNNGRSVVRSIDGQNINFFQSNVVDFNGNSPTISGVYLDTKNNENYWFNYNNTIHINDQNPNTMTFMSRVDAGAPSGKRYNGSFEYNTFSQTGIISESDLLKGINDIIPDNGVSTPSPYVLPITFGIGSKNENSINKYTSGGFFLQDDAVNIQSSLFRSGKNHLTTPGTYNIFSNVAGKDNIEKAINVSIQSSAAGSNPLMNKVSNISNDIDNQGNKLYSNNGDIDISIPNVNEQFIIWASGYIENFVSDSETNNYIYAGIYSASLNTTDRKEIFAANLGAKIFGLPDGNNPLSKDIFINRFRYYPPLAIQYWGVRRWDAAFMYLGGFSNSLKHTYNMYNTSIKPDDKNPLRSGSYEPVKITFISTNDENKNNNSNCMELFSICMDYQQFDQEQYLYTSHMQMTCDCRFVDDNGALRTTPQFRVVVAVPTQYDIKNGNTPVQFRLLYWDSDLSSDFFTNDFDIKDFDNNKIVSNNTDGNNGAGCCSSIRINPKGPWIKLPGIFYNYALPRFINHNLYICSC